jgi:hypothetical protein
MNYKVNALYSGAGIIVTYKCTAACLHCCYSSSPQREGAYMSRDMADRIFALLNKTGCHSVHIGGGEPFMNFEGLLAVCESAYENKVAIDYIETNASWFTDDAGVALKLKKLRAAGVDCLLVSLDPFHNEFVPYAKVKSLLKCCEKNNFSTFVWQSKFERLVRRFDENKTHTLSEYIEKHGEDFIENISDAYGLGYNGRALRILDTPKSKKYGADTILDSSGRCSGAIKSPHHCHVDLNGDFIPPGCIGFKINIFDLCGNGLDNEKYANFLAVADGGLRSLYERARGLGFEPDSGGYAAKCGLCFDIKKYMLDKYNSHDVGPAGFFEES